MKNVKLLIVSLALIFAYGNAQAQFGGIRRAVQRGAENAVEKHVEKKVEEALTNELEKSEPEAEIDFDQLVKEIEEARKAQEEANAQVADISSEIPEVGNMPYTPSESEFAFFALKKGAVQVLANKDTKGKITSQIRNTIKEITGEKNAFAIHYESEVLDEKGNPTNTEAPLIINFRVVVKDDIMYLDMKGMFAAMEGLDDVQASGKVMRIPSNLTVGQTLEDASTKVSIGFVNCTATMTEGKCLAIEDITVEAGTFNCYKISQRINVTAMGIKNENTTITWYAKRVGTVKSETYDKKGKLQSTQELIVNK
ncbi:MAG: hypothetical protein FWD09_06515 [Lentimicrobiaceae bacterium]|nr:hypothetical protein [Lentimicrobiaceae bacterium]